ncbi:MAG TPA: FkbM family methyltransferase [Blastocatellia bacterium]|nr:FkbM family methyltransferase [Blastocatellia bacterium]
MNFPRVIHRLGELPAVGSLLRQASYLYREGSVVTMPFGLAAGSKWMRHHRYVSGYWLGIYEPGIQRALSRLIDEGDVVYDVGANAGFFTLLAARLTGESGSVFAFDPLPDNVASIRDQIAVNLLKNVRVIQGAVSNLPGHASFSLGPNNSMAHISNVDEPADFTVETVALDSFAGATGGGPSMLLPEFPETQPSVRAPDSLPVSRTVIEVDPVASNVTQIERKDCLESLEDRIAPRPNVIKIDVEGAEVKVLEGAVKILSAVHAPKLLVELHGREVAAEACAFLAAMKYEIFDLEFCPIVSGIESSRHIVALPTR